MHAFDVLGDPVRRRVLELLGAGEKPSGAISAVISAEFKISQPAVSQHLKVLRDNGFATVRADGARRLYAVDPQPFREVDAWLDPFRQFWTPHLDALGTELARGRRERRITASHSSTPKPEPTPSPDSLLEEHPDDRRHPPDQLRRTYGRQPNPGGR